MKQKMEKTPEGMVVMVPAEEFPAPKIKQASPKFQKHTDGSITFAPVEDEAAPPSKPYRATPVDAGLGKKAVVSVPQEAAPSVMSASDEVSWTDLRPALTKVADDVAKVVSGLVGLTKKVAEGVLNQMKTDAQITDFRFLKPGQPFTMEVNPGRVQLLLDKKGVVQTAEIG